MDTADTEQPEERPGSGGNERTGSRRAEPEAAPPHDLFGVPPDEKEERDKDEEYPPLHGLMNPEEGENSPASDADAQLPG
jgi:hypothetical protein